MTLPIKKRISPELLIDRAVARNIGETQIRERASEGHQPVAIADKRIVYLALKCCLDIKRCGKERSGVNLS